MPQEDERELVEVTKGLRVTLLEKENTLLVKQRLAGLKDRLVNTQGRPSDVPLEEYADGLVDAISAGVQEGRSIVTREELLEVHRKGCAADGGHADVDQAEL